jgi:uncharacterized protein (DUF1800 family)
MGGATLLALAPPSMLPVSAAQSMGFEEARHLASRTSFGVTPAQIHMLEALEYETAIDQLLRGSAHTTVTPLPPWINDKPKQASQSMANLAAEKRKARAEGRKPVVGPGQDPRRDLEFWWVNEMFVTEQPMVERMVLFWHNHFTSSRKKVRYMPALYRQNGLFRREALGNFGTLLKQVARDPAMLIYLDGARSVARQPNENFARELLELFTLGEGHYAESDIKAAARAFTGWSLDKEDAFIFRADEHDDGQKTFLGKTGRLGGDDILNILLAHPRTAQTIVEKLWREFVSMTPDPGEVAALATLFRGGGYEIKPLLRALFLSSSFRDPAIRGALIKSPLDFVLGAAMHLGLPISYNDSLLQMLHVLGQVPFDPPNVKGWPGGERWITTYTLLLRQQFVRRMIEATRVTSTATMKGMAGGTKRGSRSSAAAPAMDSDDRTMQLPEQDRMMQGYGVAARLPQAFADVDAAGLMRVLLPIEPVEIIDPRDALGSVAAMAMLDIAYQLK